MITKRGKIRNETITEQPDQQSVLVRIQGFALKWYGCIKKMERRPIGRPINRGIKYVEDRRR